MPELEKLFVQSLPIPSWLANRHQVMNHSNVKAKSNWVHTEHTPQAGCTIPLWRGVHTPLKGCTIPLWRGIYYNTVLEYYKRILYLKADIDFININAIKFWRGSALRLESGKLVEQSMKHPYGPKELRGLLIVCYEVRLSMDLPFSLQRQGAESPKMIVDGTSERIAHLEGQQSSTYWLTLYHDTREFANRTAIFRPFFAIFNILSKSPDGHQEI